MNVKDLFIIADDLSGAIDAGTCFLKNSSNINVCVDPEYYIDDERLNVVNTNTRSVKPERAYNIVNNIFKKDRAALVIKKIDSGFRGNVSIEIQAIIDAIDPKTIIIIPAIPDLERITVNGHQYIGEKTIDDYFGTDPANNITSSFIPDILKGHKRNNIQLIDVKQIRDENFEISGKIVVFDSRSNKDIELILGNLVLHKNILFVGSLGLLSGLSKHMDRDKKKGSCIPEKIENILLICGSQDKRSVEQIKYAQNTSIVNTIFLDTGKSVLDLFNDNSKTLHLDGNIIISTENCENISSADIQKHLGDFTEIILKETNRKTIAVFGGDTLNTICKILHIETLQVLDKISPVVEVCQADSKFGKKIIISKGGSVGGVKVFEEILNYF